MAAIDDLISQIQDAELRDRIQKEVNKLSKQKKFGLVFEEHLPECTPLYDMPIKRGCTVMLRDSKEDKSVYIVAKLEGENAICIKRDSQEEPVTFAVTEIVRVAEFGEPIYPYLKPLDAVCNAPDSDLWHTLIEADNYHALQLLEYLYVGKVDCIYIDPPYNTGAKDWKYNNDYVDGSDVYRHSKWLSMMQKRLILAKKLLNPTDSFLIITIDEKEYLHLGCLLEELFPEADIQMVTNYINPHGSYRKNLFSRADEYIFFVRFGNAAIAYTDEDMIHPSESSEKRDVWARLLRGGTTGYRTHAPNLFYPVFFDRETGEYRGVGESVPNGVTKEEVPIPEGCFAMFPVSSTGVDRTWGVSPDTFLDKIEKGYIKFGPYKVGSEYRAIYHLQSGTIKAIETGEMETYGKNSEGTLIVGDLKKSVAPFTMWVKSTHDARANGSMLLTKIFPEIRFSYPKSLYAVHDTLKFVVANKKDALIIDFFAGSGTTLHAVNLLNAEDGGRRRCIMVTNNEVSTDEAESLRKKGIMPGDDAWNNLGIARYVTWPRTVCTIEGRTITGEKLKGAYLGSDIPMEVGFKSNVAFFQLGFLDKTAVSLGMQFKEMLPTLWMKTGSIGKCPTLENSAIPPMLILPDNKFAVLINENAFSVFEEELAQHPEIQSVFLATDYDVNYRAMAKNLNVEHTYQLYRDYLDHFRLNRGRN
ncbi:site-specific DNA-methyltransferase [Butyricicoccus pullicaecorum]|nr:site-specific DNA-methyltransferase [Butyricicoccus pullicaecorum]